MLEVLFRNSKNITRQLATVKDMESASKAIDDFLNEHNFKSYYKNIWREPDGTTVVDVGSHTEFFYVKEIN